MDEKYLKIILDDNPILRAKNSLVKTPLSDEDEKLINDMLKYVKDSLDEVKQQHFNLKPAVGLAAPQVGVNKQMFVVYIQEEIDNKLKITQHGLVNPKIISHSEQKAYIKSGEGCLSVEEEHLGYVFRNARITIKAYDAFLKKDVIIRARGFEAMVLQHELDHLHGILFYDHIDKQDPFKHVENAIEI